jgi:hypothetical protein
MSWDKDTKGRTWAKLSLLKAGDVVELDSGFKCRAAGRADVHNDGQGGLYFRCAHGHHYLRGQADDGEHLVGVYAVETKASV